MKYSVVTLGGAIVESGFDSKDEAETFRAKKAEEANAAYYYFVRDDEEAASIESAPTFEQYIASIKSSNPISATDNSPENAYIKGLTLSQIKEKEESYDNLYNEGAEGFNPYRDK